MRRSTTADAPKPFHDGVGKARKRTLTQARREQNRLNQRAYRERKRVEKQFRSFQSYCASSVAQRHEQGRKLAKHTVVGTVRATEADTYAGVSSVKQPNATSEEKLKDDSPFQDEPGVVQSSLSTETFHTAQNDPQTFSTTDFDNLDKMVNWPCDDIYALLDTDVGTLSILSGIEDNSRHPHGELNSVGLAGSGVNNTHCRADLRRDILSSQSQEYLAAPNYSSVAALPQNLPHLLDPLPPNPDALRRRNEEESSILRVAGFDLNRVITAGIEALLCGSTFSTSSSSSSSSSSMQLPSRLPDPWRDCIHFSRTHVVLACLYNAESMGLNLRDLLKSNRLAPSPFYVPIMPADGPERLLAAVTSPSTPLHLKPTLPQVLYPHPAFVDLIPLPFFRARVITLLATQPQVIDIHELKQDVAMDNGISYWSSSVNRETRSGRVGSAQGQPWDMRSWEIAPWFFRKWRILFDREDGEIWNQSLWWQKARGDILPAKYR